METSENRLEIKELNLIKFGKFENYKIDLTSGFNVIYGRNEAGKSTIQLFIKVMLYGIHPRKKGGERLRERDRIIPFSDTRAEGVLKLRIGSRDIEIRRTFGKTAASDKTEVCDSISGKVLPEYEGENIGEVLLGISCNIFEKTLWIRQGLIPISGSDEELSGKLMNIRGSGDENVSADAALKKLAEQKRLLKARDGRSLKGRIDILAEKREECRRKKYELATQLAQIKKTKERLAAAEYERAVTENEISGLEAEYKKAPEAQKIISVRERLLRIDECDKRIAEESVKSDYIKEKRKEEISVRHTRASVQTGAGVAIFALCVLLTILFAFIFPIAAIVTGVTAVIAAFFAFYGIKISSECKTIRCRLESETDNGTIQALEQARLVYLGNDSYEDLKIIAEGCLDSEISVEEIEYKLSEKRKLLMGLISEIKELEGKMAYQVKINELPSDIDTELNAIECEIQECERRLVVIEIAESAIREASERFRLNFVPAINTRVGEIIRYITADKYNGVRVAEDYRIRVDDNNSLVDAEYLSCGTYEQMYFALRVASAELVCGNIPLFLDDILTMYDNERALSALGFLKDMAKARQIILFTCHLSDKEGAGCIGADIINLN